MILDIAFGIALAPVVALGLYGGVYTLWRMRKAVVYALSVALVVWGTIANNFAPLWIRILGPWLALALALALWNHRPKVPPLHSNIIEGNTIVNGDTGAEIHLTR